PRCRFPRSRKRYTLRALRGDPRASATAPTALRDGLTARRVSATFGRAMLQPADVAHHLERIQREGFTILEGAIEHQLADALLADLDRLERDLGIVPAQNIFEGLKTVRIYNLLARGKLYEAIPVHANVLPIVEQVLDKGCLVSSLSSIAIGPGEDAQPIHA